MRPPSLIEVVGLEDGRARARELVRVRECLRYGIDPGAITPWSRLPWEREADEGRYRYAAGGISIGLPTLAIGNGGLPLTPQSILGSALGLWLRSDLGITLNGSTVSAWADQSGNSRNATQGTAANQPTYRAAGHASGINGRAVLECDGSVSPGDFLSLPDLSALTAGEIFIVARADADPTVIANGQGGLWEFGSAALDSVIPFTDGNVYDEFGATARKSTGNPAASLASAFIYNVTSTSSEWTSRVNGTQHYTTATNTVGFSTAPRIGATSSAASRWDGVIGELVLATRGLTSVERAQMLVYLRGLWGNIT